jgi:hypothetical protein
VVLVQHRGAADATAPSLTATLPQPTRRASRGAPAVGRVDEQLSPAGERLQRQGPGRRGEPAGRGVVRHPQLRIFFAPPPGCRRARPSSPRRRRRRPRRQRQGAHQRHSLHHPRTNEARPWSPPRPAAAQRRRVDQQSLLVFSEAVDPSTLAVVVRTGAGELAGSVRYDAPSASAGSCPAATLQCGAAVELLVGSGGGPRGRRERRRVRLRLRHRGDCSQDVSRPSSTSTSPGEPGDRRRGRRRVPCRLLQAAGSRHRGRERRRLPRGRQRGQRGLRRRLRRRARPAHPHARRPAARRGRVPGGPAPDARRPRGQRGGRRPRLPLHGGRHAPRRGLHQPRRLEHRGQRDPRGT